MLLHPGDSGRAWTAYLVYEHDLEGLSLLRLPDRNLSLAEERVAEAEGQDVELVLSRLRGRRSGGGACRRWWGSRIQSCDKHDRRELH